MRLTEGSAPTDLDRAILTSACCRLACVSTPDAAAIQQRFSDPLIRSQAGKLRIRENICFNSKLATQPARTRSALPSS